MTLGCFGTKLGKVWGIGAVGLVLAGYGCGGSSSTDINQTPGKGSAGKRAGSAGRGGSGTAGSSGGATSAGKSGTGGAAAASGGRAASAGNTGNAGKAAVAGKGGTSSGGAGKSGAANGGGAPVGGEGGDTSSAGQGGAPACNPNDTSVPFETRCLDCVNSDASLISGTRVDCGRCLCTDCTQKLQTCQDTPGCQDIAQCVLSSGCNSVACYCGSFQLADCLTGQSDGPCKDVILNAPGGHEPSAQDISAGPAATAALDVGLCALSGGACATQCM
jgi:hypothetical protein